MADQFVVMTVKNTKGKSPLQRYIFFRRMIQFPVLLLCFLVFVSNCYYDDGIDWDSLYSESGDNYEDGPREKGSSRSSSSRRRRGGGRSSSISSVIASFDNGEEPPDDIADRVPQSEADRELERMNASSYLNTAVYVYSLIRSCDSDRDAIREERCIKKCIEANLDLEMEVLLNRCHQRCGGAKKCQYGHRIGSGVFEDGDEVLTNHHVIRGWEEIYKEDEGDLSGKFIYSVYTTVENHSGQAAMLEEVKRCEHSLLSDLAWIQLSRSLSDARDPTHGQMSNLELLDPVFTIGNPGGVRWDISLGYITEERPVQCRIPTLTFVDRTDVVTEPSGTCYKTELPDGCLKPTDRPEGCSVTKHQESPLPSACFRKDPSLNCIKLDAPDTCFETITRPAPTNCIRYSIRAEGGNSGGPVFNEDGELIGLLAWGRPEAYDNLSGGPHIRRIKHLLGSGGSNLTPRTNCGLPDEIDVRGIPTPTDPILSRLSSREQDRLARFVREAVLDLSRNRR